ncbi:MAG: universal stress protein [Pseudohongiellaceae bacterium]
MKDIRKLLVIVNPDVREDYVLTRARRLAQAFRPEVELLVSEPGLEAAQGYFSDLDVHVNTRISDRRVDFETVLSRIRAFRPDLTLKSIRRRHPLARLLVTGTDWKLVRHSPAPLWLVKSRDWHVNGCILASVDPLHSKAQQNELDHLLLESATTLADRLELETRIFHCYFPDLATMFPKVLDAGNYLQQRRAEHQTKMETLLESHQLGMRNVVMARGDLIRTLGKTIRKEQANLLVLGALSRNVVERAIVGSTTERMLNESRCDVLVMKSHAQQRSS